MYPKQNNNSSSSKNRKATDSKQKDNRSNLGPPPKPVLTRPALLRDQDLCGAMEVRNYGGIHVTTLRGHSEVHLDQIADFFRSAQIASTVQRKHWIGEVAERIPEVSRKQAYHSAPKAG